MKQSKVTRSKQTLEATKSQLQLPCSQLEATKQPLSLFKGQQGAESSTNSNLTAGSG